MRYWVCFGSLVLLFQVNLKCSVSHIHFLVVSSLEGLLGRSRLHDMCYRLVVR